MKPLFKKLALEDTKIAMLGHVGALSSYFCGRIQLVQLFLDILDTPEASSVDDLPFRVGEPPSEF